MMVETMLESSQDFGMSNGSLPQWKRELLQRRAARSRPAAAPPAAAPPPPPPPPPADEDEELRYGPGIVKRLKSRYLSLALREAPRRRPSVLRRATSLEHLLDERPPPAPRPRPARPVSLAAPSHALVRASPRRDSVKRARSVDALSRLDVRDEPPPPPVALPPRAPAPREPQGQPPPPPPPSPPPALPRSARPPRRPGPLLRETERPPPDVVRSTLRKFEAAPARRPAPAARVSAVLRGLEAGPRSSTPEPRGRSPSPAAADISAIDEPEGVAFSAEAKRVPRAALDSIARAGSTVRYAFEAPRAGSHLPPLAATNQVLLNRSRLTASPRRIGVIRPMPSPEKPAPSPPPDAGEDKAEELARIASPPAFDGDSPPRPERRDPPPSAMVEPIPRPPPAESPVSPAREELVEPRAPRPPSPEPEPAADGESEPPTKPLVNGHATVEKTVDFKVEDKLSKIGTASIERAWTGAKEKKSVGADSAEVCGAGAGVWGAGARRLRAAAPAATSVVFNFSGRKEVPDYIEDDGVVRRANRRSMFKAGEPGVVLLRADALADAGAGSDSDSEPERPPSPCAVRFVNDNVLINGRSSMAASKLSRDRQAKLKLQFDDSLTRTFEYPSEISLCEDSPAEPAPAPAPAAAPASASAPAAAAACAPAALAANTHIVSAALSQYTPSKTVADSFALGLARRPDEVERAEVRAEVNGAEAEAAAEAGDARPCAAESARSWSEARTLHTDLLF